MVFFLWLNGEMKLCEVILSGFIGLSRVCGSRVLILEKLVVVGKWNSVRL